MSEIHRDGQRGTEKMSNERVTDIIVSKWKAFCDQTGLDIFIQLLVNQP